MSRSATAPQDLCQNPLLLDKATAFARRRQAGQLDHINTYYRLPERLGVTAALGVRVRHEDREGTITDTAGQYLRVLLDGDTDTTVCHVTASMAYQRPDGTWAAAAPLPDPYTTAGAGR